MAEPWTVTRTTRPGWVRAVAALMGWVPGKRLEREAILAAARKKSGLRDWGGDDFLEPFGLLLEGVAAAGLDTLGRMAAFDNFEHAVENRLQLEAAFARRPGLDRPVERPIIILGLHRSGTTLLHNLLALAPGLWAPPFWMLSTPAPLDASEKRRSRAVRMLRASRLVMPELEAVHPLTADSPEECWSLLMNTFCMVSYYLHFDLARYGEWLLASDMTPAYRHYRRQLQALLGQGPPAARIVLKCPEHLWFVDALLAVFPDALIVWTHRDPLRGVASYSSLSALNRRTIFGRFEPTAVGRHLHAAFSVGVGRALRARAHIGEGPFIDVAYKDLEADPIGTVRRVLERAGVDARDGWETRARGWLAAEERSRRLHVHRYASRQFGLSPEGVRTSFADYTARFGVHLEPDV